MPGSLARSWMPRPMLGAIDLVRVESHWGCPDLTVAFVDSPHTEAVGQSVRELESVRVESVSDCTLLMQRAARSRSPRNCRSGPAMISRWPTRGRDGRAPRVITRF